MKHPLFKVCTVLSLTLYLSACSESSLESPDPESSTESLSSSETPSVETQEAASNCEDESNIRFLCGLINPEDILRLGDSEWLLVSGMNGDLSGTDMSGHVHLVNHQSKEYDILFPSAGVLFEQDMAMFPECPGPVNADRFSAHGLGLKSLDAANQYRLYMTSHGERESVEVFEIDATEKPTIKWVGCVVMPSTAWINSVAILDDGGFLTTQFMEASGSGIEDVLAQKITGHVFEWHPGEAVSTVTNTELSGANGIVVSEDERWMYVAAFGSHEVVRFDRSTNPVTKETVELDIRPDNLRWSSDGTLYTAGEDTSEDCATPDCGGGWSVYEVNPDSLEAKRLTGVDSSSALQSASSALLVDDEIWVGSYTGDRVGIMAKP